MFIPKQEEGQGLVEYALVLVLIALAVIVILTVLGSSVFVAYARVTGGLSGQSITNSGREYIIVEMDATVTSPDGGATCILTVNNAKFVALEDGELLSEGSATFEYTINGVTYSQSTSLNGNVNETGGLVNGQSFNCPVNITSPSGYSSTLNAS